MEQGIVAMVRHPLRESTDEEWTAEALAAHEAGSSTIQQSRKWCID
jgi:hypothetical protein